MFALNTTIVFTCIIMAVYYPAVSTVLRYASEHVLLERTRRAHSITLVSPLRFTGAIFGLVAVYILPTGFHMVDQKRNNKLTRTSMVVHGSIIAFGIANLLAQFF